MAPRRGLFLSKLTCLLAPSIYLEPFCGVNVEAQLCGVPVIAPDAGAFVETVEPETGVLCHTLADYCHGVQLAIDNKFDRAHIRQRAVQRYDMYNVARKYDYAFKCIADLRRKGWYADETHS
jgi:glycosyltransferase involved in cell wall biosynthesis